MEVCLGASPVLRGRTYILLMAAEWYCKGAYSHADAEHLSKNMDGLVKDLTAFFASADTAMSPEGKPDCFCVFVFFFFLGELVFLGRLLGLCYQIT
jgi:hypothetical protein